MIKLKMVWSLTVFKLSRWEAGTELRRARRCALVAKWCSRTLPLATAEPISARQARHQRGKLHWPMSEVEADEERREEEAEKGGKSVSAS